MYPSWEGGEKYISREKNISVRSDRKIDFSFNCTDEISIPVLTVLLSILNQMEIHLVQIERKTVTTIISHSMWKKREIEFSQSGKRGSSKYLNCGKFSSQINLRILRAEFHYLMYFCAFFYVFLCLPLRIYSCSRN